MMDGINQGWSLIWGFAIGLVLLVVIIWIIVKAVNRNNKPG